MTGSLGSVLAAAVFFVASHILLSARPLRPALAGRLGKMGFMALYSAVALAGMVWLVKSWGAAPYVELWSAGPALRIVSLAVMPLAALLLVCGITVRSPTAMGGAMAAAGDPAPGILSVTRHPVLWSIALWALAHMAANGDAASLVFFAAFAALAFAGMVHIDRRRRDSLGDAWGPFALTTSVIPFAAIAAGRTRLDLAGIGPWRPAAAIALYLALFMGHATIIGASPLSG